MPSRTFLISQATINEFGLFIASMLVARSSAKLVLLAREMQLAGFP